MGQFRPLYCLFSSFSQIEKSIDGVLGIRTRGRRMIGADDTMDIRKLFIVQNFYLTVNRLTFCVVQLHRVKGML